MTFDLIFGIDPGTKTGVAIWNPKRQAFIEIKTTSILKAMDLVHSFTKPKFKEQKILCVIENPNLRKWFGKAGTERLQGVGSIKRDFAIWLEFFEWRQIEYLQMHPKNIRTKLSKKSFYEITGYSGITSEHSRDAGMMVFGMPSMIRIPKKDGNKKLFINKK